MEVVELTLMCCGVWVGLDLAGTTTTVLLQLNKSFNSQSDLLLSLLSLSIQKSRDFVGMK
jgi:hypothetical protein